MGLSFVVEAEFALQSRRTDRHTDSQTDVQAGRQTDKADRLILWVCN